MKVYSEVESCRDCPHSTNNAIQHDDPFTSGPSRIYWWCTNGKKPEKWIKDADVIDPNCPQRKKTGE